MTLHLLKSGAWCAGALFLAILAGCGGGGNSGPQVFTQVDRVGRPAVNAIFATVANQRHQTNDTDNPTDDPNQLSNDIAGFMTGTAGRSDQTTKAAVSLLSPNVLVVDLTQSGPAAYLSVESGGATEPTQHARFGGRKLTDDVIDINLSLLFGNAIASANLAPDDGKETPALTSDHVDAKTAPKHFQDGSPGFAAAQFPYLGPSL